jgi:hypothetical protein
LGKLDYSNLQFDTMSQLNKREKQNLACFDIQLGIQEKRLCLCMRSGCSIHQLDK